MTTDNKHGLIRLLPFVSLLLIGLFIWQLSRGVSYLKPEITTGEAVSTDIDTEGLTIASDINAKNIHQQNYKIQQKYCHNYLKPINNFESWQSKQRSLINRWLQGLSAKGIDDKIIDYMAREAGTGVRYSRSYRDPDYNRGAAILKPLTTGTAQSLTLEYWTFKFYIKTQNYQGLIQAFGDGTLAKDLTINRESAISVLLESLTPQHYGVIRQLADVGVAITYQDLQSISKAGLSLEDVSYLHRKSGLSAGKTLKKYGTFYSLLAVAVKALQADLVRYWLAQGSPTNPEWYYQNALDLLASSYQPEHKYAAQFIFIELIDNGVIANLKSTGPQLRTWLPPALIDQYAASIDKVNDLSIPSDVYPLVKTQVNYIFYRLLAQQVVKPNSNVPSHPCFSAAGHQLVLTAIGKTYQEKPLVTIIDN